MLSFSGSGVKKEPACVLEPAFVPRANAQFNANLRQVVRDTVDATSGGKRPLVAIGYGPRCVPVMQQTDAAKGVCDLDWMDRSRNYIMAVVGSVHDCAELQAVNRRLHEEVTVTYANVSHD